jgi:hypothetical protein
VAGNDDDGDGMTNLAEFVAGTAPNDANSLLRIVNITTVSPGSYQISWTSVPGRRYRVWYRDALTSGAWQLATADSILATGTITTHTTATGSAQRFYKVQVLPEP